MPDKPEVRRRVEAAGEDRDPLRSRPVPEQVAAADRTEAAPHAGARHEPPDLPRDRHRVARGCGRRDMMAGRAAALDAMAGDDGAHRPPHLVAHRPAETAALMLR